MSAWQRSLAVFVGGMAGGGARLAVSAGFPTSSAIPLGTLVANVTGALLLGYALTRLLDASHHASPLIPLLCTGVLGSYTTFSALSLETWDLVRDGRPGIALGYGLGSIVLGVLAAVTGIQAARRTP